MPLAQTRQPAPFHSVEAAWFWTAQAIERPPAPGAGVCRADEVVRCLDTLYRQRRIELLHARILRIWGRRGIAPNPARMRERSDWRIWREAMTSLEGPLRARGTIDGAAMAITVPLDVALAHGVD